MTDEDQNYLVLLDNVKLFKIKLNSKIKCNFLSVEKPHEKRKKRKKLFNYILFFNGFFSHSQCHLQSSRIHKQFDIYDVREREFFLSINYHKNKNICFFFQFTFFMLILNANCCQTQNMCI